MTEETVSATATISASAETVFAVLAGPGRAGHHPGGCGDAHKLRGYGPWRLSWDACAPGPLLPHE